METPEVFDAIARGLDLDCLGEIGARGEVVRAAGQDDGTRSRIRLGHTRSSGDLIHALDRQGIAALRAVECNNETWTFTLCLQGLKLHGPLLLACIVVPHRMELAHQRARHQDRQNGNAWSEPGY